jgi:hypothetical protein
MPGVTQPRIATTDIPVMLTCPIRSALWLTALARIEIDPHLARAAFALLDNVRAHERC